MVTLFFTLPPTAWTKPPRTPVTTSQWLTVLSIRFATDSEINLLPDAGSETRLDRLGVVEHNQRVSGLLP